MQGADPDDDPRPRRPRRGGSAWGVAMVAVAVALAGGALWWWFTQPMRPALSPPAATASAAEQAQAGPASAAAASAAASEPAIRYAVAEPAAPASSPAMQPADIAPALADLLGRKVVANVLQTEDFARRLVATVDALGRDHASPLLWPVNPTNGRFSVDTRSGAAVISPDNGARYTPFVLLAEAIDMERAAALYAHMYPLLQRAYVELGYPRGYFNDRFVDVIDQLLQAPESDRPIPVRLTDVKGPVPSTRPWVRYEYTDPALQSLTAGQKIMIRVGAVNERRLKARLREARARLVALDAPR